MEGQFSYQDFDLLIEPGPAGSYRARVLRSPAGECAPVQFTLPFSELELENFVLKLGQGRRRTRGGGRPESVPLKDFGGRLYGAVFQDELRDVLQRSLALIRQQQAGMRLRLRLPDTPELAELPWEFLYDPRHNRFLAQSRRTPLVRYLDLPDPPQPLSVEGPLRLLVMISSPRDYPALDTDQEWSLLTGALARQQAEGRVIIERLAASMSELRQRLRRDAFHVVHFISHGRYRSDWGSGVLVLEDRAGRPQEVTGEELGSLLTDYDQTRLAVLNACEGARSDASDPFAGVAQSLIQQGLPAVVAMQFEITDDAAIIFAREFYGAIADGDPLEAALADARGAIRDEGNLTEWGTPVLYSRAPDGRLFDLTSPAREEADRQAREEADRQAREEADRQPVENASADQPAARFRHQISMIGPSGAGKTTLAAVLLDQAYRHPPDSGIRLCGADLTTQNWINRQTEDLYRYVPLGEVDPNGGIRATTEPSLLRMRLDLGIEPSETGIELLDAPFNMLTSPAQPGPDHAQDLVDAGRRFVAQSAILVLPIDAGLLMEAVESKHKRALPSLLDLAHVEQVVRDWAAERQHLEPSLIAFCPVKCESYFVDNGGICDRSMELFRRFSDVYYHVVATVHAEAPEISAFYIPVNTIGCIKIECARWLADEDTGELKFRPEYLIRRPPMISRVGVDDLLRVLCDRFIYDERIFAAERARMLFAQATEASRLAERSEGIIRDAVLRVSGERAARAQFARAITAEEQQARHRVSELDDIQRRMDSVSYGPRVRPL